MAFYGKCCVRDCETTRYDHIPLHTFPNPCKDPARFRSWLYAIGGNILSMDDQLVYRNARVCHKHFEQKFKTWGSRLSIDAVPKLQLSDLSRKRKRTDDGKADATNPIGNIPTLSKPSTSKDRMSEIDVASVKTRVLKLLQDLDEAELDEVEQWISSQSYKKDLENITLLRKTDHVFKKIGDVIKKTVPFEAELTTEIINMPTVGDQADCTKVNTCHVDGFLYDEDETEDLVKKGILQRHYCLDCQSRNVKDLIFISHSMSRLTLQYIFKVILPSDLEGKQVLDVGSRLGVVLYAAYHLSNASNIIGVEINKECCELQERIIDQFSMDSNRIKVINSDVMECKNMLSNSDIVILNTLDFFVDVEKHKEIWYAFKKHFKLGSYLVTNRSVAETLDSLGIFADFMDWLVICKPFQMENELLFDMNDLDVELFLYTIK